MADHKQTSDKNERLNEQDFIVHITDKILEPEPIISIDGIPVFTRGNISVIGGKQKSRKTFFTCMPVVSALKGVYSTFSTPKENIKVLFFDCEQAESHVQNVLKRIYRMAELSLSSDHSMLKMYKLRELTVKERQNLISSAIKTHEPDLVVVDGLVDICEDFNSIEKSTDTIQLLMTLSSKYNCHITSVLHENKGDGNLRGHLGTIGSQKAETVIHLTNEGDCTKVEGKYTRNIGFDTFHFRINPDAIPEIVGAPTKQDKLIQEITSNLEHLLFTKKGMKYTTLVDQYSELSARSIPTAKKHISKACKLGIIATDGNLYHYMH